MRDEWKISSGNASPITYHPSHAGRAGRRQRCAEEGFIAQSVQNGDVHTLVLNEDLEGPPHTIRAQQMNDSLELRGAWLQLLDQALHSQSHQEAHLVREASDVEASLLPRRREASEVHMRRHVLEAHLAVGIFGEPLV